MTQSTQPTLAQIEQAKLNHETALMTWAELQRFFAQGVVIQVHPAMNLLDVGAKMSLDDIASVRLWHETGAIAFVTDEQASTWAEHNPELWTVVVKPYILVQEKPLAKQAH